MDETNSQNTESTELARDSIVNRLSILDVYQYVSIYKARSNAVRGGYMVRCPVDDHIDLDPSCILNNEQGSWKCFSCGERGGKLKMVIAAKKATTNAEAAAWLETNSGIVVEYKDQPKPKHMRDENTLIDGKETARYPYRDEDGKILYTVIRYDGKPAFEKGRSKDFRVHSNGNAKRRVPYNLPDLIANSKLEDKKAIHIFEGEAKAEIMSRMGYVATSGFGGTNWDWPLTWTRFFDHALKIYIHVDSDRIGRKTAQRLRTLLKTPKNRITIVDYYPNKDDGSDVIDYLKDLKNANIKLKGAIAAIDEILRISDAKEMS